jgi:hypothetical protein
LRIEKIVAVFTKDGVPQTGLSPLVKILRLSDNIVIIDNDPMEEIETGGYSYDFSTYDYNEQYFVICDGLDVSLDGGRYAFSAFDSFISPPVANFNG